mmetsp:Transcript_39710/g.125006  ORF Transcript_39710/g.125006 Transcript_39710/m.125006 type:complete len:380 (+) Transcript_39710:28-1167(+)
MVPLAALLGLFCASVASATPSAEVGALHAATALASDDECAAGDAACALNALQLKREAVRVLGQPVARRAILVDWKSFDQAADRAITRDQYSPGYVLQMTLGGDLISLEVIQTKGGLIQAFKLNGNSIVLNRPWPNQMDGSQFWPSPQSAWGWPPPAAIDPVPSKHFEMAYSAQVDEARSSVTLTSPKATSLGIQIRKSFSLRPAIGAVALRYEIFNAGKEPKSFAPWEITRVPPGGLSFFMTGGEPSSGSFRSLHLAKAAGATWFQQDPSAGGGGKLYASTAGGWLAQASGELILVKCFRKVPAEATAPGEGQIELYDGGDYLEMEVQGAYMSIPPGGTLTWQMLWYLRRFPAGRLEREKLVAFAEGLCSKAPVADDSS